MSVKEAPVHMPYPEHVPEKYRYALGHPFYALLPGLFAYSTIWMREHNRVCDILRGEHPEFDDERLFQTAKLIVLGKRNAVRNLDTTEDVGHNTILYEANTLRNDCCMIRRYDTIQYEKVEYARKRNDTIQFNTIQHNTLQYNVM